MDELTEGELYASEQSAPEPIANYRDIRGE